MADSNREVFDVQLGADGKRWEIQKEGNDRASATAGTQQQAIARAKELAKKATLGQVRVKGRDGKIRTEHTYGKDPSNRKN